MIIFYSKENCVFCTRLKTFLNEKSAIYQERKLNVDYDVQFLKENYPMAKTYPVVTIDDNFIGGYEETVKYFEQLEKDYVQLLQE